MADAPAPQIETIDDYISAAPPDVQPTLQSLRMAIRQEVPDATEAIKYGMPTFRLNGKNLITFGGWKKHIGMYPIPAGPPSFQDAVAPYKYAKGTLRFPLDEPLPLPLIREVVRFRVEETPPKSKKRQGSAAGSG
jgi:uncharacterized protein YdhG (YjbR/CyaY superfamily)